MKITNRRIQYIESTKLYILSTIVFVNNSEFDFIVMFIFITQYRFRKKERQQAFVICVNVASFHTAL
jgi:hypothetical protein